MMSVNFVLRFLRSCLHWGSFNLGYLTCLSNIFCTSNHFRSNFLTILGGILFSRNFLRSCSLESTWMACCRSFGGRYSWIIDQICALGVGLDRSGRLSSRSIYRIHKSTHWHLTAIVWLRKIFDILLPILTVLAKNSAFDSFWRFFNSKPFWNFNRGFCWLYVEFFHQIWSWLGRSKTVHVRRYLHLLCMSWGHSRFNITSSPIFDRQVWCRVFKTNLSWNGSSLFRCLRI